MAILPSSPSLETSLAISFLLSCSRQVAVFRTGIEVLEHCTCDCIHIMQPQILRRSMLGYTVAKRSTIPLLRYETLQADTIRVVRGNQSCQSGQLPYHGVHRLQHSIQ